MSITKLKTQTTQFEVNPNKEYFLAGDISASMQTVDPACGGVSRYEYMLESFQSFIKSAEDFDQHGAPTILLFGKDVYVHEHAKYETVANLLNNPRFEGLTNIDLVINVAWNKHCEEKEEARTKGEKHPGSVLLVFTDGAPTNRMATERAIVSIAGKVTSAEEFNITFLTVGTLEPSLQKFLEDLHENLENSRTKYDIFHIERLENTSFLTAATAVNH
jgi:hypothetical protein